MSLNGTVWAPIGPSPMKEGSNEDNGLVTSIAVNPNNSNVLYLGTAQGGLWRSDDAGSTWRPLFDHQPSLGIGEPNAIAIDPNDTSIIYVGTSSRVGSAEPDTIQQPASGLFKSRDGGASWVALGSGYPAGNTGTASQFVFQWINVIIVDPANSNVLYMATTSGVFTSSDAGLNWTAAAGLNGDTRSLVLDLSTPPNARILHAGVTSSGVFTSSDGGRTFAQVLSATTPAVATALGAGGNFNRVVVALAPPTSPPNVNGVQVLYVTLSSTYSGPPPDPIGVFLSKDQGVTWTKQASTGLSGTTYGGYALHMVVDPSSPGDGSNDIIYFGCQNQFRSNDSGTTFSGFSAGHPDTHTWTLVPQSGGGECFRLLRHGRRNRCLQSHHERVEAAQPRRTADRAVLQHRHQTRCRPQASPSARCRTMQYRLIPRAREQPVLEWVATFGGDGWDISYDGSSPPVLYGSAGGPASSVYSSPDDGATFPTNLTPPWTAADTGGFLLTPLDGRPQRDGHLVCQRPSEPVAAPVWRYLAHHRCPGHQRQRRRGPYQRQ